MKIWNHFTFREDLHPLLTNYIQSNNIEHTFGEIVCSVDICEDDPHWTKILPLIEMEHNSYISETKFSKSECATAEWLTIRSQWHYDYPQPENQYTHVTYTDDSLCANRDCGIGLIQQDCFRFKKTPKWGKRNFCMTNWIDDELFVSSHAKSILESSDLDGFSFMSVKNKSGKETFSDIYQIQIPFILKDGISELTNCIYGEYVCPSCGRKKFRTNSRGQFVFRKEAFNDAPDIAKSFEWFGSGAGASRLILLNQKAYKCIINNKLDSSLVFEPVQLI